MKLTAEKLQQMTMALSVTMQKEMQNIFGSGKLEGEVAMELINVHAALLCSLLTMTAYRLGASLSNIETKQFTMDFIGLVTEGVTQAMEMASTLPNDAEIH